MATTKIKDSPKKIHLNDEIDINTEYHRNQSKRKEFLVNFGASTSSYRNENNSNNVYMDFDNSFCDTNMNETISNSGHKRT